MTVRLLSQPRSRSLAGLKYSKYLLAGFYFGFVLYKAEVISWYRIQEMFRFQSFHMYGVIGTAVLVAMLSVWLLKRFAVTSLAGESLSFPAKAKNFRANLIGGTIFGLGWAMTGACPGPILALIGGGLTTFVVVLASALLGTWSYGLLHARLPH